MATEKRLIDANALAENWFKTNDTGTKVVELLEIEKAPTVDAVEVVHGRWEVDEFGHYCTACREYGPEIEGDAEIVDLLKYGTPYCPNCGAKMDGDVNG